MCPFYYTAFVFNGKVGIPLTGLTTPVGWLSLSNWPSVRNRCVIELLCVFVLSRCFLDFSVSVGGLYHWNESDLFFLFDKNTIDTTMRHKWPISNKHHGKLLMTTINTSGWNTGLHYKTMRMVELCIWRNSAHVANLHSGHIGTHPAAIISLDHNSEVSE